MRNNLQKITLILPAAVFVKQKGAEGDNIFGAWLGYSLIKVDLLPFGKPKSPFN